MRVSLRAAISVLTLALPPLAASPPVLGAQGQEVEARARAVADILARSQETLDALVERGIPGISAAIVLPDGERITLTAGFASREAERAMQPRDRMLSGSVGKTYVTAVAHHLLHAGKLELDATAASYFDGEEPEWAERVPNGGEVTLRQLLQHTSGIPRYVFKGEFTESLTAEPDRVWKPEELLGYVFDDEALFAPGEGWAYADTNYILVGMVIEKVSGVAFYDYARRHLLEPHGLEDTIPSDRRDLPGLAQGYVVMGRQMGVPERTLEDGVLAFNVQFEWCGGGWANTPLDLARWARILYSGEAFDAPYLETLLDCVPARQLGLGAEYGLGAMIRDTPAGRLVYHDGFMPGYLTTMGWFPESEISAAVQLNTDDARSVGKPLAMVMVELAQIASEALER